MSVTQYLTFKKYREMKPEVGPPGCLFAGIYKAKLVGLVKNLIFDFGSL